MEEPLVFRWKKLIPNARIPTRKHSGDAGFDLYVAERTLIPPKAVVDVSSGVCIIFPDKTWGRIAGRSSSLRKRGLLVMEAVIDGDYTGDLFSCVYNITDETVVLEAGERVSQLIPQRRWDVAWVEVEEIPTTTRGSDGFGSSGV